MNILFLTLVKINSIEDRGIYHDLLRKFRDEGHKVFIVNPVERREGKNTYLISEVGVNILKVKTFNIQKTNIIEKGIGTLAIEYQYLNAIKNYFSDVNFDLVLYSTPPITFTKVINFIKKRDNAISYLLLKDIFPQNAVDMKMMKQGGLLHKFFVKKEKDLYASSNHIGCMSEANRDFILKHNPEIKIEKVEVNPNTISPIKIEKTEKEINDIRSKYNIPLNKKVFVYGGNLGKPQGVGFLMETIESISDLDAHFLVVGSGTMFPTIEKWFKNNKPLNATLLNGLPKEDYDNLLKACDVGLIFLNKDFLIPNFPSRLLSYLEMEIPVIAATDVNTDIGKVIEDNNCGYWVESGDIYKMKFVVSELIYDDNLYNEMKDNSLKLLKEKYTVDISYNLIYSKVSHQPTTHKTLENSPQLEVTH
ncbi:MAG: glycosyltransferase family 4 protein [Ichthyobacteriaceae bacterium]|nr:glycosyltransferase family 4 protein [Ichthyobacteriaceae bacterium]